jgi:hypothetical protein
LKIHRYRSEKSGLELLLSPKPGIDVVAFVTAYKVGSRFEVNGRTGLAHLFEHMMFRGTEHYPVPFETLSSWGDRFNAFTTPDVTEYHELVPKKLFDEAARFESERMRKLLITPEGFDTERGAVVSERKMRTEDSPMGRLYWELNQLAYDRHPYKTGPIGWQEDLDATTFDDALAFYKRFYAPKSSRHFFGGRFLRRRGVGADGPPVRRLRQASLSRAADSRRAGAQGNAAQGNPDEGRVGVHGRRRLRADVRRSERPGRQPDREPVGRRQARLSRRRARRERGRQKRER